MSDTPPEVRELYRDMLLRLTPGERLAMACEMFTTARVLMRAGTATTDEREVRRELFRRLYARDFSDAAVRERIEREIVGRTAGGAGSDRDSVGEDRDTGDDCGAGEDRGDAGDDPGSTVEGPGG